jgi:hypothetical protein
MKLYFVMFVSILLLFVLYHFLTVREGFVDKEDNQSEPKGITMLSDKIMNDIYEEAINMKKQISSSKKKANERFWSAHKSYISLQQQTPPNGITEEEEMIALSHPLKRKDDSIESYDDIVTKMGYNLYLLEQKNNTFDVSNKNIIENINHPEMKDLLSFT